MCCDNFACWPSPFESAALQPWVRTSSTLTQHAACPVSEAKGRGVAGQAPGRVRGAEGRWWRGTAMALALAALAAAALWSAKAFSSVNVPLFLSSVPGWL